MNNLKSYIPIVFFILIIGAGSFGVYKIHTYASTFSVRVVEINSKLQSLEATRSNLELFKKILLKGSAEQEQMDAYVLSGDTVFKAITDLEKDGKKTGVFTGDNLGISSVSKRENSELKKLNAGEVVVTISAEGKRDRIDSYVEALTNLPFVSHIEQIQQTFSKETGKTRATITLVITEIL
ncbi:MAG: hypothetical protein V4686_02500 [Patescibacteria group bacterium]